MVMDEQELNNQNTRNDELSPDEHQAEAANSSLDTETMSREELWAENSARRREETRREVYLERNTDLLMRRHTREEDDPRKNNKTARERAADTMMLLAIGSPAYIQAYNHQVTFTLDGVETEMTQGWLYEFAKRHREDLSTQIAAGRKNGIGIDELTFLQSQHDAYQVIEVNANPQHGEMTPNRWQAIQQVFDQNEEISNRALMEHNALSGSDNSLERHEQNPALNNTISALSKQENRTSFASQIEETKKSTVSLSAVFQDSAIGLPETIENDLSTPAPGKGTGLGL